MPKSENPQVCHVHDEIESWHNIYEIREKVCRELPTSEHTDRKPYCILHKPTKEKDSEEFQKIIDVRIAEIDEKIEEIEKLPEDEQKTEKDKLKYDFRYVWFPTEVNFSFRSFKVFANFISATFSASASFISATFSARAYFSSATFSASASFISATFSARASFISATFSARTYFSSATFSATADFRSAAFSADADFSSVAFSADADFFSATFSDYTNFSSAAFSASANFRSAAFSARAYFRSATFSAIADFRSATFSATVDFRSATFFDYASFSSATFNEKSQVFFAPTSFQKLADFRQAIIKGYLYFEAREGEFFDGEWSDEEKTEPEKVKRKTSVFENRLDFAHARVENPERITFDKVRLMPSWFVNVDSRKFVFTDIDWENHRGRKEELENELKSLEEREFESPHNFRLLTISCRNLAENAQQNNRFEEASNFRRMAFECERLRRINGQKKWKRQRRQKRREIFSIFNVDPFKGKFVQSLKLTSKRIQKYVKNTKNAPFDFVHFLFRWLSFYSESWFRAFVWLFVIWFVFAILYTLPVVEFANKTYGLSFGKSIGYSLNVMILQRPQPSPENLIAMILYGLETIFAPLQAALLALAIRRKFQR